MLRNPFVTLQGVRTPAPSRSAHAIWSFLRPWSSLYDLKPRSHLGEGHEVRTTSCKILSNSISVVGTWSKFVIFSFILHCYSVAARFSLCLGSYYGPITRTPGPTSSYHVLTASKIAPRAHYVSTASFKILWQVLIYLIQS